MKKRIFLLLLAAILGVLLLENLFAWLYLRANPTSTQTQIQWEKFEDPYKRKTSLSWQKAAIHLHTDQIWFTPGRNSPEEIETVYAANGYKILGFTDYEKITLPPRLSSVRGYEWGRNLIKRHMTVLGTEEVDQDPFPLYAGIENIQWAINKISSQDGFVVINHPFLNNTFPLKILTELRNYNALEVFSPFGDIPKQWDKLLSNQVPSFCMAADDLHYLPREEYVRIKSSGVSNWRDLSSEIYRQDGESLMRYLLINTDSLEEKEILKSLQEGNYLCVRKMERTLEDPKLGPIGKRGEEVFFEFQDTPITVDFIGQNSEVLAHTSYSKKGSYTLRPTDPYVRIQAVFPTAIILSNPFFSKK
ncbi:phosphoesterase [Leptospira langatensis]|uniref:Phosphoesterase n=1 Tax=Leptospira langatensis TaxID=2484983 RepID=A0A5F1ZYF1_9LEPT|nr:phosphoesterase [Leptospira langatensis]TGK04224.1 phosphoesterase [Leptospira langatensis]TGL43704.1 phosphoesterase [Leptospira langatensis]